MNKDMRIVFMGTPEFAVPSLDILVKSGYNIVGVITAPDKPAGRGQTLTPPEVKNYALQNNLHIMQPGNLKDDSFLEELRSLKPDLGVIVAFRKLPEAVWSMPSKGSLNLHASLLPQYRGAAPINRVIMNGEKETGVTTFFLKNEIDTGEIIMQEKVNIGADETAGELHDRLKEKGSRLVLHTVEAIAQDKHSIKDQQELITPDTELKGAPKIHKEDCKIDWTRNTSEVYNLIRGLSPYPAAYTSLESDEGESDYVRIFRAEDLYQKPDDAVAGDVITNGKDYLKIATADGAINVIALQKNGKKRMHIEDFLRGYKINSSWKAK